MAQVNLAQANLAQVNLAQVDLAQVNLAQANCAHYGKWAEQEDEPGNWDWHLLLGLHQLQLRSVHEPLPAEPRRERGVRRGAGQTHPELGGRHHRICRQVRTYTSTAELGMQRTILLETAVKKLRHSSMVLKWLSLPQNSLIFSVRTF